MIVVHPRLATTFRRDSKILVAWLSDSMLQVSATGCFIGSFLALLDYGDAFALLKFARIMRSGRSPIH
jgi:hypothetical protein